MMNSTQSSESLPKAPTPAGQTFTVAGAMLAEFEAELATTRKFLERARAQQRERQKRLAQSVAVRAEHRDGLEERHADDLHANQPGSCHAVHRRSTLAGAGRPIHGIVEDRPGGITFCDFPLDPKAPISHHVKEP